MTTTADPSTGTAPALFPDDGHRTPRDRVLARGALGRRLGWGALLALLALWSMRGAGVSPGTLTGTQARQQAADFLSEFVRPELSPS